MSMSMSSCLNQACKRLIKNSSRVYESKGEMSYTDAMFKVVPRMNDVIELLINNIPKDKLGDIYDDIEYLSCRPLWSELTQEDIWGKENDWIDILEELEELNDE